MLQSDESATIHIGSKGRLTRREFLRRSSLLGLTLPIGLSGLLATAGVAGAAPATVVHAAPGRITRAQTSRERTLVMAAAEVAPSLDVEFALHWGAHYAWDQVHERFVEWAPKARGDGFNDPDFSAADPRLLESWEYAPDAKSIVFNLRKGVMSPAGNEMTADDVKYTWDRKFALKGVGGFFTGVLNMDGPDSVQVLDKYKVKFTSTQPTVIFVSIQTQGFQGVLDSTEFKKHTTTEDPWATKWMGNNTASFGPYYIESNTPNQEIVFRRHENYYRAKPYFEQIIFRQVPASSNRVALLLSGDVDVVPDLLPRELKDLQGQSGSGVKVVNWVGNQLTSAVMNVHKPPFDKVEVRKAMNYAMPYQDILDSVYFGLANQMKSPYASIYPMATQEFWAYDTDLDKAKQLLVQAGYPDGFSIDLPISTAFPELEPLAVLMQTSLAKIGVQMAITKLPQAAHWEQVSQKKHAIFLQWEQANCPDPGYSLYLYYYSKSFLDLSDLQSSPFDGQVDKIRASLDDAERLGWAKEAQRILLQDEVPWVGIVHSGSHLALREDLVGLTWKTTNSFEFGELSRKSA